MLQQLLKANEEHRLAEAALARSVKQEADQIVAAIHAEFDKHAETLAGVQLIGEYGKPVSFGSEQLTGLMAPKQHNGLVVRLGQRFCGHPQLNLTVVPRKPGVHEAKVVLQLVRLYPYKPDMPQEMPGHTLPEVVMRALFTAMLPFVYVDTSQV